MAKIVIIGAGICGLGATLLLAREGHEITVVERDNSQPPDSPQDAWQAWARKGVAQFRQPHNFMPGLRVILEAELPDVQDALRDAGASKFDMLNPLPFEDQSARAIDDKLWTYTARRPTGEWVFANAANKEPNVTVRRGVRVMELLTGHSLREGTPHVVGVRTEDGNELHADLVIDAMGRGSRTPSWLHAIGAKPPQEEQADCGFTYYTRYFSGTQPQRMAPVIMSLGTISVLTLPGDNGTWSVTVFTSSRDTALKSLRKSAKWTSTIRACPLHAHWLDGEPITDVLAMSGIVDRYRRFVVDGMPVITGMVSVADAWACTNPSAGRGLTVGFKHIMQLRDVMRKTLDDPFELALQFYAVTESEIAPWYHAQITADRNRFAEIEALCEGREPPEVDEFSRRAAALFTTMTTDPDLFRAALEYICTLTPLQEILARPEVEQRLATALETLSPAPPSEIPGPNRDQLLEIAK